MPDPELIATLRAAERQARLRLGFALRPAPFGLPDAERGAELERERLAVLTYAINQAEGQEA